MYNEMDNEMNDEMNEKWVNKLIKIVAYWAYRPTYSKGNVT